MSDKKNASGRKPSLDHRLIERAEIYLETYSTPKQDGGLGQLIPSLAGLALYLGIARSTIMLYSSGKYPETSLEEHREQFSDILDRVSLEQEQNLLNGGLGGAYNSSITKLALTKHGYSDKVETDHKSTDGSIGSKEINVTVTRPKVK